ncbi:SIS domain-containing protein [Acetobacter musti]|uniref:Phosphoheptose isomerase n=2 Tax=Acetobacter musti TaxID=864732 RepID=A0ABX0JVQ9_9PROT|nr:D-sedoheptulose 7-phosphate isomerase [Acetobacter musti]NHN86601.1 SIS domain-containing protein [Acetobacter musti]
MLTSIPYSHEANQAFVSNFLDRSAETMNDFRNDKLSYDTMLAIASRIGDALSSGGKLLVAGNGGSAADAQHIAGEFTSRLMYDRRPLAAVALTTDSSTMTAISNDYGYDYVFSRQVGALGRPGDVFLGITTSGRSPNVLRAVEEAQRLNLATVVLCGREGVQAEADYILRAPSSSTPLIQQVHIAAAHIVCALVERLLCPRQPS